MNKLFVSIYAALIFILLNAIVWLSFGLIIAFDMHPSLPELPLLRDGMAFVSLIMAGILFALEFFLARRNRIAFFLTVGLLLITSLLGFFDDFGVADFLFLVINFVPILLLIKDRAWYLHNKLPEPGNK
ncbi:MAG: hypothetical protein A2X25_14265 [Chloroflexi bacterium GWB2_49_20]|nr:MAG: hypothetical protein A2X25_14265 [Chloroflexi bacterium GWB2_49_20]OGN79862.1 MAG: hypothetical protein A2X26_02485 [Chloroflexi bacterium GWC2_49_37]OGN85603.1 MAG: hypothetical protein A2X27_04575 [Chloroflexi bacterium GWD2_49_16]HBG74481.1 hypothetical protein [Anaerolineae bacterium]HCC79646.1 hypothetical protein [Anaerolineae bacterium]